MKRSRAQNRFYSSWVDIVLTVVSIIQGLAFNDLVVRLPAIYDYTVQNNNYQLIASFVFSFVVLIRLFQTYVTAALDYDEWSVSFFDIFLIFIIGAVEYFVFSALIVDNFDIRDFNRRISIISILGIIGYLGAILRLKEELFPSYFDYRKEIHLQSVNIIGVILVQMSSTFVIFSAQKADWVYALNSLISSIILSFNIYYSLKMTFTPSIQLKLVEKPSETNLSSNPKAHREIIIKPAARDNLIGLLDLFINNFGYVYVALFDTSTRLTKTILKEVLLINNGDHALGYKSFYVAIDKLTNVCVGLIMFNSERTKKPIRSTITFITTILIVFKYLGLWGVVRSLHNLRAVSTAMPIDTPDELHITYFAVSKEFQRMGIGHQMLEFAQSIARSEGKKIVVLDVRKDNAIAQQFFESHGFVAEAVIESDSDRAFGYGPRIHMKREV